MLELTMLEVRIIHQSFLKGKQMLKNEERNMAKNCKFTAQCTESKFGISSSLSKWGCA